MLSALTILHKCLKYRNFLAIKGYLFIFPLTLLETLRVIIQLANNRLMPSNSTSTKSRFFSTRVVNLDSDNLMFGVKHPQKTFKRATTLAYQNVELWIRLIFGLFLKRSLHGGMRRDIDEILVIYSGMSHNSLVLHLLCESLLRIRRLHSHILSWTICCCWAIILGIQTHWISNRRSLMVLVYIAYTQCCTLKPHGRS